jgi:stearoyl-CoA desaturase (delta-9 desaturase)
MGVVAYALALTHMTIASVTIFLHRQQSHHALTLHPAVSHLFRFWLWLTTGMVTREWVAVHRKHHAKCETPEDPHSPRVFGLRMVLLRGAELYRAEADKPETLARYGRGTPDDWLERHLYSRHRHLGVGTLLIINLALLGPIGLSVWGIQMLWIPFFAAGVINGVGHALGYRTFATPDASTNIVPWGILIGGEELHNNHHAFPGSAKLASRPWEIDIGWCYILLLSKLRLANVAKVAPKSVRLSRLLTKPALIRTNPATRLQVLESYRSRVVTPVYKEQLQRADGELRSTLNAVKPCLPCDQTSMDAAARERLGQVLARNQPLRVVCRFRDRLQAIFRDPTALSSEDHVARHLQEWCHEASTSGIEALREFSRTLAGRRDRPTE